MDKKLEPVEGKRVGETSAEFGARIGKKEWPSPVPAEDVPERINPDDPGYDIYDEDFKSSTPPPVDQDLGFEVERIHGEDGVEVLIRDTDSPEWTSGVAWARSAPETVVTMLADAYEALKRKRNG